MANIIVPPSWHDPHLKVTEESTYLNRREILKKMGLATGGILASTLFFPSCAQGKSQEARQQVDNHFTFPGMEDLYPAERNTRYTTDRPMTGEYDATHQNNFYEFINPRDASIYNVYKYVDDFDNRDWSFEVEGLVNKPGKYDLADVMKKIPLEERVYRFRCVERWAMVVPWTGFAFADLIRMFEPTNKAKYIRMVTYNNKEQMVGVKNQPWYPWPYFEGLRMDEAMNEMSFMATGLYGKPIPKQNGAPMRLVVPWKYGYKNIKSVVKFEFIDYEPETFWHKIAPREYGFYSNVDPERPHPRWSQAVEQMLGEDFERPTEKYNGYGEFVGKLYSS